MTNVKLSFKTDEEILSLDTLINSLTSVRSGLKSVLGNGVAFNFNHTRVACFEVSMTIVDSFDTDELFEKRNEKKYSDYSETLSEIIEMKNFHTDKKYIKSIKRLLKTISNQEDDVEISFQNENENFIKTIYIENKKARRSFVALEKELSDEETEIITNVGKITTISISKKLIGIDSPCIKSEIEFKIDSTIAQEIINKRYEIGDTVEFSVEKKPHKTKYTLLYISNKTKNPTLF